MTLLLLVLIPYAIAVTVALVLVYLGAKYLRQSESASYLRQIDALSHTCDRLHVQCDDTLKDAKALAEQREAQHSAEIARLNTVHSDALERLMNMIQFGTVKPPEAVVTSPEPDAEQRVLRSISEDMIEAGALRLQAMYLERGTIVSMEELRDEARSMIEDVGFVGTTDRILKVKDG